MHPNDDVQHLVPETEREGFVYGAVTPVGVEPSSKGTGFIQGPDGSRAIIQWELAETAYIALIDRPDRGTWGVYRLGFTRLVQSTADLVYNLDQHWIRLRTLYKRARVN